MMISNFAYFSALLFSGLGLLLLDYRHSLVFFKDTKRALVTLGIGFGVFAVWDILGIALKIFYSNSSPYISGWFLGPEFPVEELLFLTFLCYCSLIIFRVGEKVWPRI